MKKEKNEELLIQIICYIILSVFLAFWMFPYTWMILASIKPNNEMFIKFFPSHFTLEHFKMILFESEEMGRVSFFRSFLNSLFISVTTTVCVIMFSAITGYALSKIKFKGNNIFNNFIIYQMAFPSVLFIIPTFMIIKGFGLVSTYSGMILPFIMSAWATFIYTQFFKTIPDALIEAARIDGASHLKIIFRIMLPLTKSTTGIVGMFTFMARWDEFLWYLVINRNQKIMPLTVSLASFTHSAEIGSYMGEEMAAAVVLTIPMLVLFVIFRNYFAEGITTTGLKM